MCIIILIEVHLMGMAEGESQKAVCWNEVKAKKKMRPFRYNIYHVGMYVVIYAVHKIYNIN